jgi:acetoin:2,6-dichlorophenolindophenol oxidoreductase subunit alpha
VQLSREELLKAYRAMATIRRFEERVQEEFSKGGIPGFVHLYAGEEASAVGVCSHLRDADYIASTHRGHGHSIAKGCDPVAMMQELFAKKADCAAARADRCTSPISTAACLALTASSAGDRPWWSVQR